jgi:hypothetical protein
LTVINWAGGRTGAAERPVLSRPSHSSPSAVTSRRSPWVYDGCTDLVIALGWIPLFLLAHQAVGGHGLLGDVDLARIVDLTLLVSFMHQPLTLGLVYGDSRQLSQRRRLFVAAPFIAVAVALVAVREHLWIVVPVAAVWNTVHTLQQRYGLCRIYSRKAGYGSARLDRAILYLTMGVALLLVGANPATTRLLERVQIGDNNASAVRALANVRPFALALFVPVAVAAVLVALALVRQEGRGRGPNLGKWIYQSSSVALILSIAVDPAAGFVAYVAAHAVEYVIVVYRNARSRTSGAEGERTILGRLATTRPGRLLYVGTIMGLAAVAHDHLTTDGYLVVLYTVGALHFTYDGVIWKLRKPAVADSFAIARAAPSAA